MATIQTSSVFVNFPRCLDVSSNSNSDELQPHHLMLQPDVDGAVMPLSTANNNCNDQQYHLPDVCCNQHEETVNTTSSFSDSDSDSDSYSDIDANDYSVSTSSMTSADCYEPRDQTEHQPPGGTTYVEPCSMAAEQGSPLSMKIFRKLRLLWTGTQQHAAAVTGDGAACQSEHDHRISHQSSHLHSNTVLSGNHNKMMQTQAALEPKERGAMSISTLPHYTSTAHRSKSRSSRSKVGCLTGCIGRCPPASHSSSSSRVNRDKSSSYYSEMAADVAHPYKNSVAQFSPSWTTLGACADHFQTYDTSTLQAMHYAQRYTANWEHAYTARHCDHVCSHISHCSASIAHSHQSNNTLQRSVLLRSRLCHKQPLSSSGCGEGAMNEADTLSPSRQEAINACISDRRSSHGENCSHVTLSHAGHQCRCSPPDQPELTFFGYV